MYIFIKKRRYSIIYNRLLESVFLRSTLRQPIRIYVFTLINVKIIPPFSFWHTVWITIIMNQNLNTMKKIIVIATLAIVCQVATANAQCLGLRFFVPHIGISIGVPAPVAVVPMIPPVGCYAYGYANPYYSYPRPVGYYGGYRGGYYNRGYREHGGYYGRRR